MNNPLLLRAEQYGVAVTTTCCSRISVGTSAALTRAFRLLPHTVQANVSLILRSRHNSILPNPFQIPHSSAIYHSQLYSFRYRYSWQLFDLTSITTKEPGAFDHKGPITCGIGYVNYADHATTCLMTGRARW